MGISLNSSIGWLLFGLLLFCFPACIPEAEAPEENITIDFSNADQQKLYDFQDRQLVDSLKGYFSHPNPNLRFLSALAFGSMEPKLAAPYVDSLVKLLRDEKLNIRSAAAYAIGQTGFQSASYELINAFVRNDSLDLYDGVNRSILEAVGKCGAKKDLRAMASVSTYDVRDTLLLEGQSWGIYRFGLRGITDTLGTQLMVKYLTDENYPPSVQSVAANYLFRNRNINLQSNVAALSQKFESTNDPVIKMMLAIALGRTKNIEVAQMLQTQYPREQDYRVKCNILRALGNFDYLEVEPTLTSALGNGNYHIATTAADFFLNNGTSRNARKYLQKAQLDSNLIDEVKFKLLGAANKYLPFSAEGTRARLLDLLQGQFNSSRTIKTKLLALDALSEFGWYYRVIFNLVQENNNPLIMSKATQVLAKIAQRPDFNAFFGAGRNRVRRDLAEMFRFAIDSGDPGAIAEAANVLADQDLNYQELFESTTFLRTAQIKLKLPKETETYNALQAAIDNFNGVSQPFTKPPDFNHPIDWDIYEEMGKNCQVTLNTDRGPITIELLTENTPASCINFYQLARTGYFNNKSFHRVVSNFVIQSGCPRGDGYGSLDYSIRSEFYPAYYNEAGLVGMASAGRHTEGTQFFITHSPTHHLDGKYTLFGKVVDGLEFVHKIRPDDKIISVSISN